MTDTGEEVVRPSTIIRGIIGSSRLPEFTERRDGPGLVFAAAHVALVVVAGWLLWRVLGHMVETRKEYVDFVRTHFRGMAP